MGCRRCRGTAGGGGERRADERCGPGPVAAEPTREPAGAGWPGWRNRCGGELPARPAGRGRRRQVSGRGRVAAGLRRSRASQATGERDAASDDAAHGAAEPAEDARTGPLVGLGRKAGGVEGGWHRAGIIYGISRLSRYNVRCVEVFLKPSPARLTSAGLGGEADSGGGATFPMPALFAAWHFSPRRHEATKRCWYSVMASGAYHVMAGTAYHVMAGGGRPSTTFLGSVRQRRGGGPAPHAR